MNFFNKSILLLITGGLIGLLFSIIIAIFFTFENGGLTIDCCNYPSRRNGYFFGFLLGFIIISIFITTLLGIPCLYIIEKYFNKYKYRYIFGSILMGYFLASFWDSFPQEEGIWFPSPHGIVLFMLPTLLTGLTFTFLVSFIESRKK